MIPTEKKDALGHFGLILAIFGKLRIYWKTQDLLTRNFGSITSCNKSEKINGLLLQKFVVIKQTDSGEIINSSEEQKFKTVFRRVRLFLPDTETTEWEVR